MPSLSRRSFVTGAATAATAAGFSALLPGNAVASPLLGATGSTGGQQIGAPGLVGVRAPEGSVQALGDVRFALPNGWSDWMRLPVADGGTDGSSAVATGPLATPDGALGFEVRAPEGSQPVFAGTAQAEAPAPEGTEVAGKRQVPGVAQYSSLGTIDCYGIPVVSRRAWGCDESISFGNIEYRKAQLITVHHSVTPAGWDPAATMRSFHRYHSITNGWGDIGYQLVIDPSGQVYQGHRTHTGYPVFAGPMPAGIAPDSVVAAHVAGNNSGNVGVCLMGNFDNGLPTPGAYAALVNVLARLSNALNIDPLGGVGYWNPDGGYGRGMPSISSHRDWMSTGCPGQLLYNTLPQLRQAVAFAKNTGFGFPTSAGSVSSSILPGSTG